MLAPPHQGSEIIDWLSGTPLQYVLGPAGKELGLGKISVPKLPSEIEAAVIMGSQSKIPFFRKLLNSENDGIVSVESGKIEGLSEFHTLEIDHTFIVFDPRAMEMTNHFLTRGEISLSSQS